LPLVEASIDGMIARELKSQKVIGKK